MKVSDYPTIPSTIKAEVIINDDYLAIGAYVLGFWESKSTAYEMNRVLKENCSDLFIKAEDLEYGYLRKIPRKSDEVICIPHNEYRTEIIKSNFSGHGAFKATSLRII